MKKFVFIVLVISAGAFGIKKYFFSTSPANQEVASLDEEAGSQSPGIVSEETEPGVVNDSHLNAQHLPQSQVNKNVAEESRESAESHTQQVYAEVSHSAFGHSDSNPDARPAAPSPAENDSLVASELEANLNYRLQTALNSESEAGALYTELETCNSDPEIPQVVKGICSKHLKVLARRFPQLGARSAPNTPSPEAYPESDSLREE
jgi:hypothetical protein